MTRLPAEKVDRKEDAKKMTGAEVFAARERNSEGEDSGCKLWTAYIGCKPVEPGVASWGLTVKVCHTT